MFVRNFFYSFAVCLQIALAPSAAVPTANGQNIGITETTIEDSLGSVDEAVEEAIERLSQTIDQSTQRLASELEVWAEEHSAELEAWAEKHSREWETWAENLEQKFDRAAREQEQIWQQWAGRYEKSWDRWAAELEAPESDAETIGKLIDQNFKMLAEMPLGRSVDQAMQETFDELRDAPWESLDEFGALAEKAVAQPLKQLEKLDLSQTADKKSIQRDAKIRALENLLKRDDLTEPQRHRVENSLRTTRDAKTMLANEKKSFSKNEHASEEKSVAEKQEILAEILVEQKRHAAAMQKLHESLQQRASRPVTAESEIERLKSQVERLQKELKANRGEANR